MKISKLFHWLYASVMMLPLVVAPIYAIFMHRHQVTNYEVTTGGYEVTEKYQTNEVNNINDIVANNVYHLDNFSLIFGASYDFDFVILNADYCNFDFFIASLDDANFYHYDSNNDVYVLVNFYSENEYAYFNFNVNEQYISYFYSSDSDITFTDIDFYVDSYSLSIFKSYCSTFSYLPSASTFQSYEYQYNEGLTYNDTDIGSQFIYSIYLPLNKYFNVTNFLGLNNLYSWINTNVFSGTAPLGFSIFYMLLSYWLLVSIFWLVFDVVMYVPNLAHRWLDKGSLQ